MSASSKGNLSDIYPLRFRLRGSLQFCRDGSRILAERMEDGRRFVLLPWQRAMLDGFDGRRSFEEVAREIYGRFPGAFDASGLLSFHRWIDDEDLIRCECQSVFELVPDEDEDEPSPVSGIVGASSDEGGASGRGPGYREGEKALADPAGGVASVGPSRWGCGWRRLGKVCAVLAFCLALLRVAYVTAPVFEPAVDRLHAEVRNVFVEDAPPSVMTESEQRARETEVRGMELAGRAVPDFVEETHKEVERPPGGESEEAGTGTPKEAPGVSGVSGGESVDGEGEAARPDRSGPAVEDLRRRLAQCRIRRDECYLQDDEEGYRKEVRKMTALTRRIGEIESEPAAAEGGR